MKRIEIITAPDQRPSITGVLEDLGLHFTYYDSKGRGTSPTSTVEFDRGTDTMKEEFNINVTIMTVVPDSMEEKVVTKILDMIRGNDGRIFVHEIKEAIDIRTRERGDAVL